MKKLATRFKIIEKTMSTQFKTTSSSQQFVEKISKTILNQHKTTKINFKKFTNRTKSHDHFSTFTDRSNLTIEKATRDSNE